MPRRYRPPTRRRKSKKERLYQEKAAPPEEGAAAPAASPPPVSASVSAHQERFTQVRHIARDHSYVLGEVRLIAFIVAFIIAGLVITAILR